MAGQQVIELAALGVAQHREPARKLLQRRRVVVRAVLVVHHHATVAQQCFAEVCVVVQRHLGALQRKLVGVEGDGGHGVSRALCDEAMAVNNASMYRKK